MFTDRLMQPTGMDGNGGSARVRDLCPSAPAFAATATWLHVTVVGKAIHPSRHLGELSP